MTRALILLIFLVASSCSKYIAQLEEGQRPSLDLKERITTNHWCSNTPYLNIIHNDPITKNEFKTLLPSRNLTIADIGINLTLYQMLSRPDATDWKSRVQIHIKQGKRIFSKDFGPQNSMPLFTALKDLEEKKFLTRSLKSWIKYANTSFPRKFKIQKQLTNHLTKYAAPLQKNRRIRNMFFRLGKPLQYSETYKRPSIKIPRNISESKIRQHKFPMGIDSKMTCSFDSGLYQKGIFLISSNPDIENVFGAIKNNGDYFIMVTKKSQPLSKLTKSQILPGETSRSLNPFCQFHSSDYKNILIGLNSRDSGQLLYHLYNYGINDTKGAKGIFDYISLARHQFLLGPGRLLYESKRGSDKRLRYFLGLDFPVYHVKTLGTIFGMSFDTKTSKTTFITDPREKMYQSCQD